MTLQGSVNAVDYVRKGWVVRVNTVRVGYLASKALLNVRVAVRSGPVKCNLKVGYARQMRTIGVRTTLIPNERMFAA